MNKTRTNHTKKKPRGKPFDSETARQYGQQPGQPGRNPKGRPPSKKYLSEALREWLAQPSDADPEATNADALAAAIGKFALSDKPGAIQAAALIADRVEGKARQQLDVSIEDRRRKLAEHAIEALMIDAGIGRDEAIAELARLTPEIKQWIH